MPGALYMRVNGTWEPVTPYVPDEVQIATTAPTTGGADLWVKKDDVPPSINALIDGVWTKITQPVPDEVWVGTTAPTDANVELWYDTDAPGYTPDDLRWQNAWGVVAIGTISVTNPLPAAATTVGTVTVTLASGRRYHIYGQLRGVYGTQQPFVSQLWDGSTQFVQNDQHLSTSYLTLEVNGYRVGDGATHTITWKIVPSTTNMNVLGDTSLGTTLVVEDVGPVAGAPVVPSNFTAWTAMTLASGWSNMSSWQPAQYRKLGDMVQLRGLITNSGANITIWNPIPAGYGPPYQSIYSAPYATPTGPHAAARIDVYPTYLNGVAPVNYLSLNGIEWSVSS